jgi:hypothetical protein
VAAEAAGGAREGEVEFMDVRGRRPWQRVGPDSGFDREDPRRPIETPDGARKACAGRTVHSSGNTAKDMRDFIVFFEGKEGTSVLLRQLGNFDQISVVHNVGGEASSEPFDRHACGPMRLQDLVCCFDLIFGDAPLDMHRLNAIYTKTAKAPLKTIDKSRSVGFKMRFHAPSRLDRLRSKVDHGLSRLSWERGSRRSFRSIMIDVLAEHDLTVFLAVRQDVLRWALSKYHGDGTGKPGHIQFRLASGSISRDDIGKIYVDTERLADLIRTCEKAHAKKRRLMEDMRSAGLRVQPLRYEDFLADKMTYFSRLLHALDIELPAEDLEAALARGGYFEKVHSHDISTFVTNHEEVMERFGNRSVSW